VRYLTLVGGVAKVHEDGVGEVPKSGNPPDRNMDGTSEEPVMLLVPVEVLSRKFKKLIIANPVTGATYTSNFQKPPLVSLLFFSFSSLLLFIFWYSNVSRQLHLLVQKIRCTV